MKIKILFLLLISLGTFAQRTYDSVIQTENPIKDLVQNQITGIIVIKEGPNIKGIDPETKETVWSITKKDIGEISIKDAFTDPEFGSVVKGKKELTSVDNSPYIEAFVNSKYLIINTETGKIVYNSSKETFYVFQSDFIPESDEYLLTLKSGPDYAIALLDMKTGLLKWKTTIEKYRYKFVYGETLNTNIAKINGNNIYYLLHGKLYSFNKTTGALNWNGEEEYSKFFLTQNDKNIVVLNNKLFSTNTQYLNVLSTDNGKSIWKDAIKTKRVVYLEDWGTKLLVAHYSGFNFFDLKTGEKIWKKDARGAGLKRVIPIEQDFLYLAENDMMLINKNGEKLWKNYIQISDKPDDPIYYLDKVGEKVMYLTGTYGNMVDYKSGRKLWKRNIRFKQSKPVLPAYDEASNSFLVYNDEKLYKFNPSIDDKPEPFAEVNIKRENELNSIEMFPWGVVLSGPVEVMGVNMDGKIKYHKIYTQPGEGNRQLIKGISILGSIAMGMNSLKAEMESTEVRSMTYRDEYGVTRSDLYITQNQSKVLESQVSMAGSQVLDQVANRYGSRFKAMKQNKDFAYIYAKDPSDEKVLVKVRKSDGEEIDKLIFKNDRPVYEVDPVTQNIFYIYNRELQIFNAKK